MPNEGVRILFCESSRNWGGQELLACRQILWLNRHGHKAALVCDSDSQVPSRAREMGVKVITVNFDSRWAFMRIAMEYFLGGYRALACCSYRDHVACLPLRRLGASLVRSRHISHPVQTEAPLFVDECDRVICVSLNVKRLLVEAGVAEEKIVTIPNGVDLHHYRESASAGLRQRLGLPHDALLVGQIGMMRHDKGQDVFLQAAEELSRRHPDAHFYLAGEDVQGGNLKRSLEEFCRECELASRVHFLGYVEDSASILNDTDILVIASRATESSPLVLREALASGCAVIATDLGDVSAFLISDRNGLVVPPGDVPALIEAMDRVMGDAAFRRRLAAEGLALADAEFDFDKAMERFCAVFRPIRP